MKTASVIEYLREYGRSVKIMEVCGSHTSAIIKAGFHSLISPSIKLVSGPGCPVCVTPPAYIDALVEFACVKKHTILSFGDMFRVPGNKLSLAEAKAIGGCIEMIYSPLQAVKIAQENPAKKFIVAAVGFETTAPVFAVMIEQIIALNIRNLQLCTALKVMPPMLEYICRGEEVDAFLCPGHVSAIIGTEPYNALAERYQKPCVIAGFEPEHILVAIYSIIMQLEKRESRVQNCYKAVVSGEPQPKATALMQKYFALDSAYWRGIDEIAVSGLYLREEYSYLDAGSKFAAGDSVIKGCRCREVLLGRIKPDECRMFGEKCTPQHALGACMVSPEGACGNWYNHRGGA